MTTYQHHGAVIDRLLDELGQPAVHSVRFEDDEVTVRIDEPTGLAYRETRVADGYFYAASIIREDVQIHVTAYVQDEEAAA
ncbi:hypothetical protein Bra3105_06505 [Brachybacterium halotolerans subsp. kimchii]|uniref:hypothetical protein n=1 Tax=Brachybacterium halotolerans TaxID=2795215 RepID=UPI001E2E5CC0|nr:hypothetical protein [Brachybacterium halotolerans]UEJ83957.1 hypothetical protein Bra3105_06505 [Brachybacterium halotolerans subsp. kimchii]